jgi:hypothetical protein
MVNGGRQGWTTECWKLLGYTHHFTLGEYKYQHLSQLELGNPVMLKYVIYYSNMIYYYIKQIKEEIQINSLAA